jgi:hypothetical protein
MNEKLKSEHTKLTIPRAGGNMEELRLTYSTRGCVADGEALWESVAVSFIKSHMALPPVSGLFPISTEVTTVE